MNEKNLEKIRKIAFVILLLTIFLVPVIVSMKIVPVPESLQQLYNKKVNYDFFAYGKAQVLHIGTIVSLILVLIYQWQNRKKKEKTNNRTTLIILSLFSISVILSFLLSENKELAWVGMIDRYEGTFTWLCYIGLTYITMSIIKTRKEMNSLIYAFVLSASIVSVIGAFQMFGMDFFKSDVGKLMMLGSRYEELFMKVNFNFPEGQVYTTLYNPNYVGSLVALSFPLTLYSIYTIKKWWIKPIFALLIVPQIISLIGSQSTGGVVAVAMSIVFIGIYLLIKFPMRKMVYVGIGGIVIVGYLALTQLTFFEPYYNDIMNNLNADSNSKVITEFASVEYNHPEIRYYLQNGESISISPIEGGLDVSSEGEGEVIQDEKNKNLTYKITSDNYLKQVIYYYKEGLVRTWVRNLQTEKTSELYFNYYNSNYFSAGTLPLNKKNYYAESIDLFNNERFMNGRGYIWNRTLPMIVDKPMFGYGADTYTINYPQGDLIDKTLFLGSHVIIVDKPHNLFLNVAFNFGFIGLIFYFLVALYSIVRSRYGFFLIPIMSYFIVGLVNDSVVFATYIIFVLFGLLLALSNIKGQEL